MPAGGGERSCRPRRRIERHCAVAQVDAERRIEAPNVTRFVWLRQFEPGRMPNSADANPAAGLPGSTLRRLERGLFHDVPAHRIGTGDARRGRRAGAVEAAEVNRPWDYQTPCPTPRPYAICWSSTWNWPASRGPLPGIQERRNGGGRPSQTVRSVPRPAQAAGGCSQRGGSALFRASSSIPSAPARPLPADQLPAGIPVNMGSGRSHVSAGHRARVAGPPGRGEVTRVCAVLARCLAGAPPSSSGLLPPHLRHSRGRFGSTSA